MVKAMMVDGEGDDGILLRELIFRSRFILFF
jgi:hypothetical protein